MKRYELNIKVKAGLFTGLLALWLVLVFPLSKILDTNQVLDTAMFFGILIIPALGLGLFTKGWSIIFIPILAYLTYRFIYYTASGFNTYSSDMPTFALVILHLALCAVMILAFVLGRGLGAALKVSSRKASNI